MAVVKTISTAKLAHLRKACSSSCDLVLKERTTGLGEAELVDEDAVGMLIDGRAPRLDEADDDDDDDDMLSRTKVELTPPLLFRGVEDEILIIEDVVETEEAMVLLREGKVIFW